MISKSLKALKDKRKLTNQQLSELSGVPLGTVNRIMAGQVDGANFNTVRDLTVAMGGSLDEMAGIVHRNIGAASPIQSDSIELYSRIIIDKELQLAQKDAWIRRLFRLLALVLGFMTFVMVFDVLNAGIGYIRA